MSLQKARLHTEQPNGSRMLNGCHCTSPRLLDRPPTGRFSAVDGPCREHCKLFVLGKLGNIPAQSSNRNCQKIARYSVKTYQWVLVLLHGCSTTHCQQQWVVTEVLHSFDCRRELNSCIPTAILDDTEPVSAQTHALTYCCALWNYSSFFLNFVSVESGDLTLTGF